MLAGDTVWLRSGYHGDLSILRYYNTGTITLAAEEGHTPCLSSLRIRSGSHWTIRGLTVSAEFSETYERHTLIDLDSHSWSDPVHDIAVEDCMIRSEADASTWTAGRRGLGIRIASFLPFLDWLVFHLPSGQNLGQAKTDLFKAQNSVFP